jgi:hypothetical protein
MGSTVPMGAASEGCGAVRVDRIARGAGGVIIVSVDSSGVAMCHDWWLRRRAAGGEASRRLWGEFEQTRPLSDPDVRDGEDEVTLQKPEPTPVAAQR